MVSAESARTVLLSIVSGCAWGTLAYVLGRGAMGGIIWGGVIASPVIGLLVGLIAGRIRPRSALGRVFLSLAGLYGAAILFGLAVGLFDLATGVNSGDSWYRNPGAVLIQSALGTLWGMTLTGYVIAFWPLAYLNHWLIWRLGPGPGRDLVSSRLPST